MIGFEDVKIISWNVQGAMNENGKLFIKDLVRNKRPDVVILMEPKCQSLRVRRFWTSLGFSFAFVMEAVGFSGGIWVLTNNSSNLSFRLVDLHAQVVTFEMWRDSLSWVCSAVYTSPIPAQRESMWRYLIRVREDVSALGSCWGTLTKSYNLMRSEEELSYQAEQQNLQRFLMLVA